MTKILQRCLRHSLAIVDVSSPPDRGDVHFGKGFGGGGALAADLFRPSQEQDSAGFASRVWILPRPSIPQTEGAGPLLGIDNAASLAQGIRVECRNP